jgi:ribosomal protein S18 acetylase RimI-like enzyme
MSEVRIRRAVIADIPALLRHRRMMWWDMGERQDSVLHLMGAAADAYFKAAVADGSYQGFVAIEGEGKVIGGGGIVISPWPGILHQRQPSRAMILNLYVEREYRRRGVARSLMKEMIAWCRDNGFAYVGLHASEDGRALYEQLGFKSTNEMRLTLGTSSSNADQPVVR